MASSAAAAPSDTDASRRVLSIQSHVVHGHVGNKSAVFPLQLLGFEVDPICSVQFSNHTGYPTFKGQVLQGHQLSEIVQGLEANGLLQGYSHMLTGYIGSVSFLQAVLETVRAVRAARAGGTPRPAFLESTPPTEGPTTKPKATQPARRENGRRRSATLTSQVE